jgi:hypothetical protein
MLVDEDRGASTGLADTLVDGRHVAKACVDQGDDQVTTRSGGRDGASVRPPPVAPLTAR